LLLQKNICLYDKIFANTTKYYPIRQNICQYRKPTGPKILRKSYLYSKINLKITEQWVYFQAPPSWAQVEPVRNKYKYHLSWYWAQESKFWDHFVPKTFKKSYLKRVRFRTQSQQFQATDLKFRLYSWDIHMARSPSKKT
jgi:hypothetical protein